MSRRIRPLLLVATIALVGPELRAATGGAAVVPEPDPNEHRVAERLTSDAIRQRLLGLCAQRERVSGTPCTLKATPGDSVPHYRGVPTPKIKSLRVDATTTGVATDTRRTP